MRERAPFRQAEALRDRVFRPMLDRWRRRTSASDRSGYINLCARAAADPEVFARFKQDPDYTAILEHVTCEQGADYLSHIRHFPEFAADHERFRANDRLGRPRTCTYGTYGRFSPTTLRYIKVLSDLQMHFGELDGLHLLEIGGGYGGQCFVASVATDFGSYSIVDLDPCLDLQAKYLQALGVANVRFIRPQALGSSGQYDLVVSNYAFSECTRETQERYLDVALRRSERGYLTCNWISPPHFRSLAKSELLEAIVDSHFLPEVPSTGPGNALWIWGNQLNQQRRQTV